MTRASAPETEHTGPRTPKRPRGNTAPERDLPVTGRDRVVIDRVRPDVDRGRFEVKGTVGETVGVRANVYADGHDSLRAVLRWRMAAKEWREIEMTPLGNDAWQASFLLDEQGVCEYTIAAWVDHFESWRKGTMAKAAAGQDIAVDARTGAAIVRDRADRAKNTGDAQRLTKCACELENVGAAAPERLAEILSDDVLRLARAHDPRPFATELPYRVRVRIDRARARYSTWYELFPRSMSPEPGRHGTLRDIEAQLGRIASLGFDVLYLPPIHPIGTSFRKGANNMQEAAPGDVGSPWAIGAPEGGHTAIHPALGTFDDFDQLVRSAQSRGMEVALDIAFQCSPDHPWVAEHPEWFRTRPDGTIQYAENPPKKYQDIYPFDFESGDWRGLWRALRDVMLFWAERGVRIFRVDNPHTKPFAFWEWAIAEIKDRHPDVLFLSEAFTRPAVMYRLAKLGFTQSYTYFAWRHAPWELEAYFKELTSEPIIDFFRPNAWPNTPDILTEELQHGGRAALTSRLILAATLCANYGIYGPPYEAADVRAREPGSEEYLDSEKYQLRHWDLPGPMSELIGRVNRIRREHLALQQDRSLHFHRVNNPAILCYSKRAESDAILVAVNTDKHVHHWCETDLDLNALGLRDDEPFEVHDLLTDARYAWRGRRNTVGLNPAATPAHIFHVRRFTGGGEAR